MPCTRETHAQHIEGLDGLCITIFSTTYGITCDSLLNSSKYFHVTNELVMDIMHDLLEGVLQFEVKELLKYLIDNNYCTVRSINSKIASVPYDGSDVITKPTIISAEHLRSSDHKTVCYKIFHVLVILVEFHICGVTTSHAR